MDSATLTNSPRLHLVHLAPRVQKEVLSFCLLSSSLRPLLPQWLAPYRYYFNQLVENSASYILLLISCYLSVAHRPSVNCVFIEVGSAQAILWGLHALNFPVLGFSSYGCANAPSPFPAAWAHPHGVSSGIAMVFCSLLSEVQIFSDSSLFP